MKLSTKQIEILKSYLRGVITASAPLLAIRSHDLWAYAAAIVAGVIAPALRAVDKNDPAFGLIADAAVSAVNQKVAKPTKTK